MGPTICCAYLRIYQPESVLSGAELERYHRVASATTPEPVRPHPLGLIAADERREFYVRESDGELLVCPSQTHIRTLLGLLAFERSVPDGAERLFFDSEQLRSAHRQIEELESCSGELRPSLVQSAWHVPIRWFVCFSDDERRIEHDDEQLRLRYETTLREARTRIARALDVLKGGIVHPVVVGMVYELNEWLKGFHERAVLELDYASVSRLFDEEQLADDHSARDVWDAIYALADGDGMRAGLHYRRVNERWSGVRARESLN